MLNSGSKAAIHTLLLWNKANHYFSVVEKLIQTASFQASKAETKPEHCALENLKLTQFEQLLTSMKSNSYQVNAGLQPSNAMTPTEHIAKHFREVYFGGNWTSVSLRESLADVDWQKATARLGAVNTIATLVYHTNYYVRAIGRVLRGEPLSAKDAHSFDCPVISSEADWQKLLAATWDYGETLAALIQQLPTAALEQVFTDEKYGTYHRNLHGVIEHAHYHLGQIVLIKKLLTQTAIEINELPALDKS